MFSDINNIVITLIIALAMLLLSAIILLAYVCVALLRAVQVVLSRVESSLTTQQQYMYMMRGDVDKINKDLSRFFDLNGFINMVSRERFEAIYGVGSRAPPEQPIS